MSSNIIVPKEVSLIREEKDLKLYHYTDQAVHPGPSDYWKGVVIDGNQVVAQSYPWSPTVVEDVVPDGLVFTPLYEATIVRFYKVDGKPMISTHRQIDISDKNSRVGSGRPFIELIKEAIAAWDYKEYEYESLTMSDLSGESRVCKGLAFTPSKWQDLCTEGYCHVFLLLDISNQITDLTNLIDMNEITSPDGEIEVVSFNTPKLLHAITFVQSNEKNEFGIYPMVPIDGDIRYRSVNNDRCEEYMLIYPKVEKMDAVQADNALLEGGAVIGFNPETPDITVKYLSYEYARKIELAGDTFNPIHRWHQLMDQSVEDANEYIENLPYHLKHTTIAEMQEAHMRYLNTIMNTLTPNVIARLHGKNASLDPRLYNKVSDILSNVIDTLRQKYNSKYPNAKNFTPEVEALVLEEILQLSYTDQHAIHGMIQRINVEKTICAK